MSCLVARWMKESRNPHTSTRPDQIGRERKEEEERSSSSPFLFLLSPPLPLRRGPPTARDQRPHLVTPRPKVGGNGERRFWLQTSHQPPDSLERRRREQRRRKRKPILWSQEAQQSRRAEMPIAADPKMPRWIEAHKEKTRTKKGNHAKWQESVEIPKSPLKRRRGREKRRRRKTPEAAG